jgi:hypothetical protein
VSRLLKRNLSFYVVTEKVMKLTTYKILGIGEKMRYNTYEINYFVDLRVSALSFFNSLKK